MFQYEKIIDDLIIQYANEINDLKNVDKILNLKNQYFKTSVIEDIYKQIPKAIKEEKGALIKIVKNYQNQLSMIAQNKISMLKSLENKVTTALPVRKTLGSLHIMTIVNNKIDSILQNLIFEGLKFQKSYGNDIESEFYNFTALNIPDLHPCRTDHQSFFVKNGILRTQCTSVTAHLIEKHKSGNGAFYTIGKTYRRDLDATHLPQFNQMDILVIHEKANFENLITFVQLFLNTFFGEKLKYRLRPSYFPFTNFSSEVDVWFNGRWMEILGCGVIAPEVFDICKSEQRMSFAMGIGLERLIMIKYGITDIRDLYKKFTGFNNMIDYSTKVEAK